MKNKIGIVSIIAAITAIVAFCPGCGTITKTTTNGVTVTTVNTNALNADLDAMVAVGVPALRIAEGASSQVRPILQDVALALTTILNGASTQTASQILTLAGSRDANLNAQLAPLISLVSAVESKYLLPLAGTSAYGYVSIRVAQSLQTMVTGALATSP